MPRPTPRQRAVLEAMRDGAELQWIEAGWVLGVHGTETNALTVRALARHGLIRSPYPGRYTITEAGRRAVARSDGDA